MDAATEPKTLQEAIVYFKDPVNCRVYLVARRWPNGVVCPRCGSTDVLFLEKYHRWHCRAKHDAPQFTLKTGTIMEDSPLGLDKWMTAMWQIVNCKNGISSYQVHRALGITQKTAWFLDHRIRLALTMGTFNKLSGQIEADETFISAADCREANHVRSTDRQGRERLLSSGRGILRFVCHAAPRNERGVLKNTARAQDNHDSHPEGRARP